MTTSLHAQIIHNAGKSLRKPPTYNATKREMCVQVQADTAELKLHV